MGLFSKLTFWKKDDEISEAGKGFEGLGGGFGLGDSKETGFGLAKDQLGLGKESAFGGAEPSVGPFEKDINMRGPGFEHIEEPTPMKSMPLERKPIYYQEVSHQQGAGGYGQPYQRDVSKDLEVISAKLDSIKSMLDMINHRIDAMERQQGKKGRMEW